MISIVKIVNILFGMTHTFVRVRERGGDKYMNLHYQEGYISSLPLLLPLICDAKAMWELLITERVVFTINAAAIHNILQGLAVGEQREPKC